MNSNGDMIISYSRRHTFLWFVVGFILLHVCHGQLSICRTEDPPLVASGKTTLDGQDKNPVKVIISKKYGAITCAGKLKLYEVTTHKTQACASDYAIAVVRPKSDVQYEIVEATPLGTIAADTSYEKVTPGAIDTAVQAGDSLAVIYIGAASTPPDIGCLRSYRPAFTSVAEPFVYSATKLSSTSAGTTTTTKGKAFEVYAEFAIRAEYEVSTADCASKCTIIRSSEGETRVLVAPNTWQEGYSAADANVPTECLYNPPLYLYCDHPTCPYPIYFCEDFRVFWYYDVAAKRCKGAWTHKVCAPYTNQFSWYTSISGSTPKDTCIAHCIK